MPPFPGSKFFFSPPLVPAARCLCPLICCLVLSQDRGTDLFTVDIEGLCGKVYADAEFVVGAKAACCVLLNDRGLFSRPGRGVGWRKA